MEKQYRKWGTMKNAKKLKIQVDDTTLIYLERRSYIGQKTQVGYGQAIADLCRDFQGLLKEHQQLLSNYKNLLNKYSAVCAKFSVEQKMEETKTV
jgi:hypothetical protein